MWHTRAEFFAWILSWPCFHPLFISFFLIFLFFSPFILFFSFLFVFFFVLVLTMVECCFFNALQGETLIAVLCDSEPVESMVNCLSHPLPSTCDQLADQNSHPALADGRVPGGSGAAGWRVCFGGAAAVPGPCLAVPSRSRPAPRGRRARRRFHLPPAAASAAPVPAN